MAEDTGHITKIYTYLKDSSSTTIVASALGTLLDATMSSGVKSCLTLCVTDRYYKTLTPQTINPYVSFIPSSGSAIMYFYTDNVDLTYPYTLQFKKIG